MRSEFISYYEHEGKDGYLEIDMCPVCKYVYKKFTPRDMFDHDAVILKGSKPFIEFLEKELSKDDYDEIERHTKYACPKCGVIQIAINGEFKEDEQD